MIEIVDAGTTTSGTDFKIKTYQLVALSTSKLLVNLLASIMHFICNFLNSHSVFMRVSMKCPTPPSRGKVGIRQFLLAKDAPLGVPILSKYPQGEPGATLNLD